MLQGRLVPAVAAVTLILGAACGGGGASSAPPSPSVVTTTTTPTPSPTPTCIPTGTELEVVAQDESFVQRCLVAPADTAFTIEFDNRDALDHNIDILDHPGGTALFTGDIIVGPKMITYHVKPLPAGTFYFRCDVHPLRMHGTFLVGG